MYYQFKYKQKVYPIIVAYKFVNKIFDNQIPFAEKAQALFQHQYNNNPVYADWCNALQVKVSAITHIEKIPFLPISFFKSKKIITGNFEHEIIFESSGTTQTIQSKHYLKSVELYKESFCSAFALQYGNIKDYCVLALLPSYLERKNSSLIFMTDDLINQSGHQQSGCYLYNFNELKNTLEYLEKSNQKILLIGVSFALLDFAEQYKMNLTHTIIIETGGMKGRKKEITREELYTYLKERLGTKQIHSEYGMTELLSQAYSKEDGIFYPPPWMKVLVRDDEDPLAVRLSGTGVLNIIDLANIYSCAFIATDDVGTVHTDGSFSVKGRLDASDMRGCSLLVA